MEPSNSAWLVFFTWLTITATSGQFINDQHHQTEGAKQRKNDLWCYRCDTMDEGDKCTNLSAGNQSKLVHKCSENATICMVKRYSYTTSTENSTSLQRMWSLERNCTASCDSGCIVIGERTKLYACTACCQRSLCNTGRGGAGSISSNWLLLAVLSVAILVRVMGDPPAVWPL